MALALRTVRSESAMFQLLNLSQEPDADHSRSALPATIRTPRHPKDGLNNGLKSPGLAWISVDVSGSSQKRKVFIFNDLKCSVDVLGNPWKVEVERVKGIEPSLSAWEAGVMPLYDTRSERLTLYQKCARI